MSGKNSPFWDLEIYKRYEMVSEILWNAAEKWPRLHQSVIGEQLLDAIDSVGSNISESVGRWHVKESLNLLYYARGSLSETQHWIRVGVRRKLFTDPVIKRV